MGKDNTGRVEPIPIEIKNNRAGLGREAAIKRIKEAKAQFRLKHAEQRLKAADAIHQISAQEFRDQLAKKNRTRQTENDLYKSQKACHQLDIEKGFKEPAEAWFWPARTRITDDQDDQDAIDEDNKAMDAATASTKAESGSDSDEDEDRFQEVSEAEPVKEEEFSTDEKLEILTGYLRSQYLYCLWCGITFSDQDEMTNQCPGATKADHDD